VPDEAVTDDQGYCRAVVLLCIQNARAKNTPERVARSRCDPLGAGGARASECEVRRMTACFRAPNPDKNEGGPTPSSRTFQARTLWLVAGAVCPVAEPSAPSAGSGRAFPVRARSYFLRPTAPDSTPGRPVFNRTVDTSQRLLGPIMTLSIYNTLSKNQSASGCRWKIITCALYVCGMTVNRLLPISRSLARVWCL